MGYREAQYNVCRLTAQGLVSPADYKRATDWCSTLAESGDPWGEYGLARMLEEGVGTQPDLKKAAEWYTKSAEQGNPALSLAWPRCTLKARGSEGSRRSL